MLRSGGSTGARCRQQLHHHHPLLLLPQHHHHHHHLPPATPATSWRCTSATACSASRSADSSPTGAGDADPRDAVLWAVQQQQRLGVRVVFEGSNLEDEEDDELADVLDDLEDPWMRNPSPPEWAEALPPTASSAAEAAAEAASGSDGVTPPVGTAPSRPALDSITSEQLLARLAARPQPLVLLCVVDDSSSSSPTQPDVRQQLDAAAARLRAAAGALTVEVVQLQLADLTSAGSQQWREAGSLIAVADSGHHSCLAAAIRLSAVHRLPDVVLLQVGVG